jgi:hypothetical protein
MHLSALWMWLGMLVLAVVGGGVRERLLAPKWGSLWAGQVETLGIAALFAIGIVLYARWLRMAPSEAMIVGAAWCLLTICFETLLGRAILKQPWSTVIANYDVVAGSLWPIVLLVMLVTPYVAARWLRH